MAMPTAGGPKQTCYTWALCVAAGRKRYDCVWLFGTTKDDCQLRQIDPENGETQGEVLPPSHESPPIELVRYKDNPQTLYRPVSIMRDVDGSVLQVDCGAVVLSRTKGLQAKINGQWSEI